MKLSEKEIEHIWKCYVCIRQEGGTSYLWDKRTQRKYTPCVGENTTWRSFVVLFEFMHRWDMGERIPFPATEIKKYACYPQEFEVSLRYFMTSLVEGPREQKESPQDQ